MKSPASLVTAVGLLVGGSWEVRHQSGEYAAVLLTAGLILLGAWLALEIRASWPRREESTTNEEA